MMTWIWVNNGSGDGLVPAGNNPSQWRLLTGENLWHSPENNITLGAQAALVCNAFDDYTFNIIATSLRGP